MLEYSYHLPHNSVRVDEFNFMLNVIDLSKTHYTYSELRELFLIEEINSGFFSDFHPIPHRNLLNHSDEKIRNLYVKACNGDEKAILLLLENDIMYTDRKTWKQVWNEFVRDYVEFFAFIGVLPSYYKGLKGGENKHYVTNLLKKYRANMVTISDLLLNFKFRNASKNHENYEMYHIEVRPFVLAVRILKHYYSMGHKMLNPHILSAIVTYSRDEFKSFESNLSLFSRPMDKLSDYAEVFNNFNSAIDKEVGRATLLLKPYLREMGVIEEVKIGTRSYYKILPSVCDVEFSEKSVFCAGDFGKYKLTPMLGKVLNVCYNYTNRRIGRDLLFDGNFLRVDQDYVLEELLNLGVIDSYNENTVNVSSKKNQYAINPYSEFFTINDAYYVDGIIQTKFNEGTGLKANENVELINNKDIDTLRYAATSSHGTLYEETLYNFLTKHIGIFKNIKWYGQFTTAQRLSDLAGIVNIYENGEKKKILVIMECKSGNAISAFDERKERADIINTMKKYEEFDGVWYWVVDGNSLPNCNIHGGYRSDALSKSFPEKLNELQFEINMQSNRPAIVTAFSINALISYLKYLIVSTKGIQNEACVTEYQVPHFWRWSKKFMNLQYITVHQEITL